MMLKTIIKILAKMLLVLIGVYLTILVILPIILAAIASCIFGFLYICIKMDKHERKVLRKKLGTLKEMATNLSKGDIGLVIVQTQKVEVEEPTKKKPRHLKIVEDPE